MKHKEDRKQLQNMTNMEKKRVWQFIVATDAI